VKTWYATNRMPFRDDWIEPVQVEKETDRFITIVGSKVFGSGRTAKKGQYRNYYPTWQEARNSLLTHYSTRAENLRRELVQAEKNIAELNALQEPESP